jgi:NAD-dependent dihydropyrimidine dehydrogenase PreA subunit
MKSTTNVNACKEPPRIVHPVIHTHKCEGSGDCESVCPYDVFAVRRLKAEERRALPLFPWLKVIAHGGKQAFVVNGDDCHACGLCVAACPEKAIRLTRTAAPQARA